MTSNYNPHEFSRRSFLKTTACLSLGSLAAGHSLAATLIEKGDIALVVPRDDVLATAQGLVLRPRFLAQLPYDARHLAVKPLQPDDGHGIQQPQRGLHRTFPLSSTD